MVLELGEFALCTSGCESAISPDFYARDYLFMAPLFAVSLTSEFNIINVDYLSIQDLGKFRGYT